MTTATLSTDSKTTDQTVRMTSFEITSPTTFARDLAILKDIIPRKTPKPILKSIVLLCQENGIVTALASNLEQTIRLELRGCYVQVPGTVCIDLEWLTAACKATKDATLWVDQTEDGIRIATPASSKTHRTDNPEHFPVVPIMPFGVDSFTIGIDTLAYMFEKTKHAMDCQASNRYALAGVFLERSTVTYGDGKVSFSAVATNGCRLEKETTHIDEPKKDIPPTAVIPPLAIKVFQRFAKEKGRVSVTFHDGKAFFAMERAVICTQVVDGRFPRYADVFPSSRDTSVDIWADETRDEIVRTLADMAKLRDDGENGITVEVNGNSINMSHTRSDGATTSATVKIPYRSGLAVKCVLDAVYLGQGFASHQAPLRLEFLAGNNPVVIKSVSHETLIMPLRVDRADWNPGNPSCRHFIIVEGINDSPRENRRVS